MLRQRMQLASHSALVVMAQHPGARSSFTPFSNNPPSSHQDSISTWSAETDSETVFPEPLLIQSLVFRGTPAAAKQEEFGKACVC
mmetsp:Transcript_155564/g.298576  ORF Transcript_155564/g.298576 Transcript_155564/m.298576 type:complete len:85 (+) Transcript_155564:3-257(+)